MFLAYSFGAIFDYATLSVDMTIKTLGLVNFSLVIMIVAFTPIVAIGSYVGLFVIKLEVWCVFAVFSFGLFVLFSLMTTLLFSIRSWKDCIEENAKKEDLDSNS